MNRLHKCMLLICLITHSVLPTGQALSEEQLREHNEKYPPQKKSDSGAIEKEDSLTRTRRKIIEAHPNFSNFVALPPEYYEPMPENDPLEQPPISRNKNWELMRSDCDYFGILHFKEDISLAPMPLKIPVYLDEEVGVDYECEFSDAAKTLVQKKGASWFIFKSLYATSPKRSRQYLKRFGIDIKGVLFPENIPSSRKSTSRGDSLASRSSRFVNEVIGKITKSPSSRGQNTYSGSSMSDVKNRMSRSNTLKSMTSQLVRAVNPSKWSLLRNRRVGLAQTVKKANQNQANRNQANQNQNKAS